MGTHGGCEQHVDCHGKPAVTRGGSCSWPAAAFLFYFSIFQGGVIFSL